MSKKNNTLMFVSKAAHTKIKVEASKEGKSITRYLDELVKVDNNNYKKKEWGKLF